MTRSLIVNCSLKPSNNETLLKIITKFSDFTLVHFKDINADCKVEKDMDAVVMSGSAARIVNPAHRDMFKGTVNLIKHLNLPLFSICYGHQLLSWSLGAGVGSLSDPVNSRFEKVRIVEVDEIFAGFERHETIPLAQYHYDYVLKENLDEADPVLLADSQSCEVEAIKHKHNPFYGVQFHPERIDIGDQTHQEGHKVIENFCRNVVRR